MERPRTRNVGYRTAGRPAAAAPGPSEVPDGPGGPNPYGHPDTDAPVLRNTPPAAHLDPGEQRPFPPARPEQHPHLAPDPDPQPHPWPVAPRQARPVVARPPAYPPADAPDLPAEPAPSTRRLQVRRVSVRGQILDALRTALAEGELIPGEVYSAPALGERFGVSATPVREAMQQLAGEGAVQVVPNRGFRVVGRSAPELAQLAEVRALIEVPVVLRLAHTVPTARWAELAPLAEAATVRAGRLDRAGYAVADRAFHRALLGLAGNEQLVRTVDELHQRAQWPRVSALPTRRGTELLAHAAQHTALLDALAAGDLTAVESLVREHFTGTED